MKINRIILNRIFYIIIISILLVGLVPIGLDSFFEETIAESVKPEHLEYKSQIYQEKLTIPARDIKTIDFYFQGGKALEFIFKLYVQEELPINVWFVNNDNYTKLIKGNEYNFFIDGSEEQVIFTTKIVSVTEYDTYKLILANYNETLPVNVDIVYEGRVYDNYSTETSFKKSGKPDTNFLLYIFVIIVISVIVLDIYFNIRRSRRTKVKGSDKTQSKKAKNKRKSKTNKTKKNKNNITEKAVSKKSKNKKSKQKVPEITFTTSSRKSRKKASTQGESYCGYCGKPVNTPFCTNCGEALKDPVPTVEYVVSARVGN